MYRVSRCALDGWENQGFEKYDKAEKGLAAPCAQFTNYIISVQRGVQAPADLLSIRRGDSNTSQQLKLSGTVGIWLGKSRDLKNSKMYDSILCHKEWPHPI